MLARAPHASRTPTLLAVAGPALMGAVLGIPLGTAAMLSESLRLPTLVAGLALLTLPALYIGLSLASAAPPARDVARAAGGGLQSLGLVLAGLAPAVAFLLATSQSSDATYLLGAGAVATAALLGLRQLFARIGQHGVPLGRLIAVYVPWALIALGLGAHFFLSTFDA